MIITEVKIYLPPEKFKDSPLKAFCSLTFDKVFVIHNVKVIEGKNGLFITMPSRKKMDYCHQCRTPNHLRAGYCNYCGQKLDKERAFNNDSFKDSRGRLFFHQDVAHPITAEFRSLVEKAVLDEYDLSISNGVEAYSNNDTRRWGDEADDLVPL